VGERELERKAAVAELLLSAARQLGETLEPERVYDRFHELLAGVVPHDGVVVSSYDESDGLIRCEYAWVEGNRLDPETLPPLPLNKQGGGMQSRVIVSGEPLVFNDVVERVQDPDGTYYNVDSEGTVRKLPESGPAGTTAAMMVPVSHEGRVVGVVQVMSDTGAYTPEQLEVVDGLVVQMAAAVRNARLQRERLRLEAAEAAALAVAGEREQAAQVLDAVGDGIFLVDVAGVVRLWNRAAELATGLPGAGTVGRRVADLFPEWEAVAERIPVAERGLAARSVTVPLAVGGVELWLSFVAVRSTDDGVVYAFRDLTGERRLDEEKSDLIATISHELRTPMAAVYGAAQTLLRPDLDPASEQGRRLLEMIASQSARLSRITEEVLLASRLDRGDVTIEPDLVDVGELVLATAEAIRQHEDAPIAVELPPEPPQAAADSGRLQQVLLNLLDNAAKYGGDDTVTVRVEDTDAVVRISVADSGPGILPAEQERIFEKFYRSDPHLTHGPSGTGLGLYISRELVRRMGGRLDVRSEPGAGATFVVDLPRAQADLVG
jgi:PAS domain S-box-containing protein